ncbi:MAG TPA: sulfotransferase family 2 domain-containing protein [Solirubrobacteraceae bacterium]|nr:sulfotransferase family 2 domain-containing protein [Solirubrobacteraceae bacterium]
MAEAIFAAGIVASRPPCLPFHGGLGESLRFSDRFTFAFVRHPFEFWLSYWGYRMRTGWDPDNRIDAAAASEDFEEFVDILVARAPGAASTMYESYVGPPGEEIDFIGRHERLADDLCLALRLAGEEFDQERLRDHPPVNCADFDRYPARYTRSTAERLLKAESASIERFYAHEPLPTRLLAPRRAARAPIADRLQRSELELRDARAELAQHRRADHERHRLLKEREQELADTTEALSALRSSRLVRWSRPLRTSWYAWRTRRCARPVARPNRGSPVDVRRILRVGAGGRLPRSPTHTVGLGFSRDANRL